MLVYCITNLVNGKKYVGQTVRSIEARWRQHCTRNRLRALGAAIQEYGPSAFSIEKICAAETQDELNRLEQHWIAALGTLAPNGYNLCAGGGSGGRMSPETVAKMRATSALAEVKARRSKASSGRVLSAEHRRKIAASNSKPRGPYSEAAHAPRPAYQSYWNDPEWRAALLAKRKAAMTKWKAAMDATNQTPETKARRSEAARKREAQKRLRNVE